MSFISVHSSALLIFCRNAIASVFQGRGVSAASTSLSASSLKQDSRRHSIQKLNSFSAVAASSGVKKSSVCLQTKFQLVSVLCTYLVISQFPNLPPYILCVQHCQSSL